MLLRHNFISKHLKVDSLLVVLTLGYLQMSKNYKVKYPNFKVHAAFSYSSLLKRAFKC